MPATKCLTVLLLLSMVTFQTHASDAPNPIRRVITMLQMMSQKVEQEGKNQEALFDKYMCYCQQSLRKLNSDIQIGEDTVPQLEGSIKEGTAEKGALENDIKDAKEEFAEAQKTLDEATSLRTKENKDFKAEDTQMKADIKSLNSAVKAMDKLGEGGAFLQTRELSTIRRLTATSVDISSSDRDVITNFLSQSETDAEGVADGLSESSPAEITGILKQMEESMTKDNEKANEDEKNAQGQYDSLKSAKESQMGTLKAEIATKTERAGQVGLQLVEDEGKLEDTNKALASNTKLRDSLDKECKSRRSEYDEEMHTRSEEQTAISDTIKILNDEVTSKLFKNTMVSASSAASFLQLEANPVQLRGEAYESLRSAKDPRMTLVALAVRSKKVSFTNVLKMIDNMIALLNKEQQDDVDKKEYCKSEIDKTDDEKKELEQSISDLKKAIESATSKADTINKDIATKTATIKDLDKQVDEATKQRKEEHTDYMENLQANNAAKSILTVAKARLAKFYDAQVKKKAAALFETKVQPKKQVVGKALKIKALTPEVKRVPEHSDLSEDGKDSLSALFGDGEGAFSFAQVDMQTDYVKEEAENPVIKLITSIVADIEKEVSEMTADEKEAQFEFEYAIKESAEKRSEESRALSTLEGNKAEVEAELHKMTGSVKSKTKESAAKSSYLDDLHQECDFLLKNFKVRREARTGEIDALQKAKMTLTGADAGFLQVNMRTRRGLRTVKRSA